MTTTTTTTETKPTITGTDKTTQRTFVLARLKERPHSTNELREMGIYSPPPRVQELRKQGYNITTVFREELDSAGVKHRVGVYVLAQDEDEK